MSYSDGGVSVRSVGEGRVVVSGVDIPFGDLVVLIIKMALAAIPAYFILFGLAAIVGVVFGGIFGGILGVLF